MEENTIYVLGLEYLAVFFLPNAPPPNKSINLPQSQQTSQQDFLNAICQADYKIYMVELLYKNSQDNF